MTNMRIAGYCATSELDFRKLIRGGTVPAAMISARALSGTVSDERCVRAIAAASWTATALDFSICTSGAMAPASMICRWLSGLKVKLATVVVTMPATSSRLLCRSSRGTRALITPPEAAHTTLVSACAKPDMRRRACVVTSRTAFVPAGCVSIRTRAGMAPTIMIQVSGVIGRAKSAAAAACCCGADEPLEPSVWTSSVHERVAAAVMADLHDE